MNSGGQKRGGDYRTSAEAKAHARANCAKINSTRHLKPKCGAHSRSTDRQCGNLAMANGKCYRHGGKTPKGDAWHKPRWPKGDAPDAVAKLDRKLKELSKRAKERARRLARRSPEALAAHEAWQKFHQPGPAARRASDRARLQQDRDAAAFLKTASERQGQDAGNAAIRAQIAALEAQLREMDLREAIAEGKGVFG